MRTRREPAPSGTFRGWAATRVMWPFSRRHQGAKGGREGDTAESPGVASLGCWVPLCSPVPGRLSPERHSGCVGQSTGEQWTERRGKPHSVRESDGLRVTVSAEQTRLHVCVNACAAGRAGVWGHGDACTVLARETELPPYVDVDGRPLRHGPAGTVGKARKQLSVSTAPPLVMGH